MATHRIPILGWPTVPDNSGDMFFEPYGIKTINDILIWLVVVFNDTSTRIGLRGGFAVPKNYSSAAYLIVV